MGSGTRGWVFRLYSKVAQGLLMVFDDLEGRSVHRCHKYLARTQWMKSSELARLQLQRLKALLKFAYDNVPLYNRMFKEANFKPESLVSLEDIQQVPILKRSKVGRQHDEMGVRGATSHGLFTWSTSGTTAAPVSFFRTKRDLSWGLAAELRTYGWAGYEAGDKMAILWRVYESGFKYHLRKLLKRTPVLDLRAISERSMERFARKMRRFKPDFVRGYAGCTNLFAAFLAQNEHLRIWPKAVFTSGQTLQPHYRKNIEHAFGCPVYDCYGTNEVYFVAGQCGEHEGLHVAEENILVEVVDDNGWVAPGEQGRVLLTNLHSYGMPFIRYEIGDSGRLLSEACSCGRKLKLFKPTGRQYEYFFNSDGSFTFLKDFQILFEDVPIKDFQVVQETPDLIILRIAPNPGYQEAHTEFIKKHIKVRGSAEIRIDLVDSIPPDKSGKIPHLVTKLATKYT